MVFSKIINDAKLLLESEAISNSGISKFPTSFSLLRYPAKESKIHQLILEHLIKAESRVPGGSTSLIKLFDLKNFQKKNNLTSTTPTKSSLIVELLKYFDQDIVNVCLTATQLSGPDGKIFLENTSIEKIIIELKTGVRFSSISPTGDFQFESGKFVTIDGFIESVSELNNLLSHAVDSKDEIILVCRGMSNDVLNTLSVNLKRKTLNVRPIVINFDENGINTLKDISVSTSSRLYSSDLGDLISTISTPDNICHPVKYSGGMLHIDLKTNGAIEQHISYLQKKISEEESDLKIELLRKRLVNLCSRNVSISVPVGIENLKLKQNIDECLRMMKHYIMNGILREEEKFNLVHDIFESLRDFADSAVLIESE